MSLQINNPIITKVIEFNINFPELSDQSIKSEIENICQCILSNNNMTSSEKRFIASLIQNTNSRDEVCLQLGIENILPEFIQEASNLDKEYDVCIGMSEIEKLSICKKVPRGKRTQVMEIGKQFICGEMSGSDKVNILRGIHEIFPEEKDHVNFLMGLFCKFPKPEMVNMLNQVQKLFSKGSVHTLAPPLIQLLAKVRQGERDETVECLLKLGTLERANMVELALELLRDEKVVGADFISGLMLILAEIPLGERAETVQQAVEFFKALAFKVNLSLKMDRKFIYGQFSLLRTLFIDVPHVERPEMIKIVLKICEGMIPCEIVFMIKVILANSPSSSFSSQLNMNLLKKK